MITRATYGQPFGSLRKNLLSGGVVPPALDQKIGHMTVLVNGAPETGRLYE